MFGNRTGLVFPTIKGIGTIQTSSNISNLKSIQCDRRKESFFQTSPTLFGRFLQSIRSFSHLNKAPHSSHCTNTIQQVGLNRLFENSDGKQSSFQKRNCSTYFRFTGPNNHSTNASRFSRSPVLSADSFLTPTITPNTHTILQFTDLHHYNDGSREDRDGVQLIGTLAERVKPDLVVLTGDIIDGRYCGSYKCFRNVVAPLIDLNIPWTYVPGNHDDETKAFSRKDLLNIYSMPLCASRNSNSFTHTLRLGPMQLYLMDSHGYEDPNAEAKSYDFIKEDQISWYLHNKSDADIGLGFFHIPLLEFKRAKVIKGSKGEEPCTPSFNSGFFKAIKKKKDIHALFTGHDHWNDFVSELDGVWLCYGRVSGFTHTAYYGEGIVPMNKERGGRVIRYESSKKLLSTWVENKKGIEHNSLISKNIVSQKFDVVTE